MTERRVITISLDEVTHKRLHERAEVLADSKSEFVRDAFDYLFKLDEEGKEISRRGLTYIQDKQFQLRVTAELQDKIRAFCERHKYRKADFYITAIKNFVEATLRDDATKIRRGLWTP